MRFQNNARRLQNKIPTSAPSKYAESDGKYRSGGILCAPLCPKGKVSLTAFKEMILEFASNILSSTLMDITNGNQLISDLLHHTLSFAKDMQFTSNQTVKWFSVANDVLIEALASETAPELSVCYTSFKNGLMQVFDDDATLFTVDDMEQMIKFFSELFFQKYSLYQLASRKETRKERVYKARTLVVSTPMHTPELSEAETEREDHAAEQKRNVIPPHLAEVYESRLRQELEDVEKEFGIFPDATAEAEGVERAEA